MFVPMCVCVCEREKERGFEKLGALCFFFSQRFGGFPSICGFSLSCKLSASLEMGAN